jgi:hypothetical protein
LAGEGQDMDALDLTRRPPRSPRELLPNLDLLMMARTVDKLRATLPGGNIGSYQIPGFSARLLQALEISEDRLRQAVAAAGSDDDVVAWIREHSDPGRYAGANEALLARRIRDRIGDADFDLKYPNAKNLPPEMPLLDFLITDDRESFGQT